MNVFLSFHLSTQTYVQGKIIKGTLSLTCDLTDVEVISRDIFRTPGISFHTVNCSRIQVFKSYQSLCGVEAVLCVRAVLGDAETVEDSMSH